MGVHSVGSYKTRNRLPSGLKREGPMHPRGKEISKILGERSQELSRSESIRQAAGETFPDRQTLCLGACNSYQLFLRKRGRWLEGLRSEEHTSELQSRG